MNTREQWYNNALDEAVAAAAAHGSKAAAASALGIPRTTLQSRLKAAEQRDRESSAPGQKEELSVERGKDSGFIRSVSSERQTPEQAFEASGLDPVEWEIERSMVNYWDAMKGADHDNEVVTLYQVKVWIRRRIDAAIVKAADLLVERMKAHSPKLEPVRRPKVQKRPCALEFSPFDSHVGKLSWRRETGEDYDLKIARHRLEAALEDTLDHWAGREIEEVWIPTGGDFLHTDFDNATTGGTPQDSDGRPAKVFDVAAEMLIRAVERARRIARVKLIHIPGNHDRERSYYLARFVEAWFRRDGDVEVIAEPTPRIYVEYGDNLIGFAHGKDEPLAKLPLIMPLEVPQAWARTTTREWHCGDKHHRKKIEMVTINEADGVVVRILPSLASTDAWHHRHGYIGSVKAAESYLWGKSDGYLGNYLSVAKS